MRPGRLWEHSGPSALIVRHHEALRPTVSDYVDPVRVRMKDPSKRKHLYEDRKQTCDECGTTKSVKAFGSLDNHTTCKACRNDTVGAWDRRMGELTWAEFADERGLSLKHRRVVRRAAKAYAGLARWACDNRPNAYPGERVVDVLVEHESDPRLASTLYAGAALLGKEMLEADDLALGDGAA